MGDMKKHIATATAVVIGTLTFAGLANLALDKATAYHCPPTTVRVQHGDTAWGIASRYCTGHTGAATAAIVHANGTHALHAGDTITLP